MTHRPRKRFGQHFLNDPMVIDHIIHAFHPQPSENIVEIGPGLGALTQPLLRQAEKLSVIELDRDLIAKLESMAHPLGKLTVYQGDILNFDLSTLGSKDNKLRVIGNLPYNISTPLLFHLLDSHHLIHDMMFMLQKEVASRLAAVPGTSAYGRLTLMVQYACEVTSLFDVPPQAFTPPPQVNSSVVKLVPYASPPFVADSLKSYQNIVRDAFNQRRKTIRNALKNRVSEAQLQQLGIDPQRRPEQLSLEEYVKISNMAPTFTI